MMETSQRMWRRFWYRAVLYFAVIAIACIVVIDLAIGLSHPSTARLAVMALVTGVVVAASVYVIVITQDEAFKPLEASFDDEE